MSQPKAYIQKFIIDETNMLKLVLCVYATPNNNSIILNNIE